MPRNPVPAYRKHKSGNAVVDVYLADGRRIQRILPGEYGLNESLSAYRDLIAHLQAHGGKLPLSPGQPAAGGMTIKELVLSFLDQKVAVTFRNADGTPKREADNIRRALRPLVRLFGCCRARDFDGQSLDAVRQAMLSGSWLTDSERDEYAKRGQTTGQCRTFTNRNVGRIRACFRWGVKKIVPASVVIDLECWPPLGFGEAGARETDPIEPVATEIVDATLPHLPPVTADLVRVVLFTGARIGEICKMRSGDLDRSGDVWIYRPRTHKNKHRGHSREICCGPRTQAILRRYLKENPDSFVFSPREQAEMIRQEKRANRESPVQPSQIDRSRSDSTRTPGEQFNHNVIDHAIRRACKKHGLPHWHPHQFRHLKAQEVTRELGAEAARATLGHRTVKMTGH